MTGRSREYIVPVRVTLHEFTDAEAMLEPKEDPERAKRREEIRSKYNNRAALAEMCHVAIDQYVDGDGTNRHPAKNAEIEDLLIDIVVRLDEKASETRKVLASHFRGY